MLNLTPLRLDILGRCADGHGVYTGKRRAENAALTKLYEAKLITWVTLSNGMKRLQPTDEGRKALAQTEA